MSQAVVCVIAPVLIGGQWVNSGEVEVDFDDAKKMEASGVAEIVSIDGEKVVWSACCDGGHDHQ